MIKQQGGGCKKTALNILESRNGRNGQGRMVIDVLFELEKCNLATNWSDFYQNLIGNGLRTARMAN